MMQNLKLEASKLSISGNSGNQANIRRLIIILLLVFLLMTLMRPSQFPTISNFNSMMRQFPEYGIMAIGISLTMITGGIDLGVVGTANLSAILAAKYLIGLMKTGVQPDAIAPYVVVAIFISIATGLMCGAFAGFLISKLNIPPILATLGTQQLFTGIAIGITSGRPQSGLPLLYSRLGNYQFFNLIPVSFIIFMLVAFGIGFLLSKTSLGFQMYMLGTNAKASRYAGLNNHGILIRTYMLSGFLSSLAGLIMMARANSAKAEYGTPYTLQCVLIAVLGGIDANGGAGSIAGVAIAILILQFLSSGLNMFNSISNFYRDVIWGGVLLIVLMINKFNLWDGKRKSKNA